MTLNPMSFDQEASPQNVMTKIRGRFKHGRSWWLGLHILGGPHKWKITLITHDERFYGIKPGYFLAVISSSSSDYVTPFGGRSACL